MSNDTNVMAPEALTESQIHKLAKKQVPLKKRVKHTAVTTVIYICCVLMAIVCLLPLWLLFVDATRATTQINQEIGRAHV